MFVIGTFVKGLILFIVVYSCCCVLLSFSIVKLFCFVVQSHSIANIQIKLLKPAIYF